MTDEEKIIKEFNRILFYQSGFISSRIDDFEEMKDCLESIRELYSDLKEEYLKLKEIKDEEESNKLWES